MRRTHQMLAQPLGHDAVTRGANWKLSPPASSAGCTRATSTSTTRKSTNCTRPVCVGVVEEQHLVEDPDGDRADDRARERHHAADQRRGQPAQQRVRARSPRARPTPASVAMRMIGHRREEPGDGPHAGRHHLRVDAGEAGEVGVRRRRRAPTRRTRCGRAATTAPSVMSGTTIERRGAARPRPRCRGRGPTRRVNGCGNGVCSEPVR